MENSSRAFMISVSLIGASAISFVKLFFRNFRATELPTAAEDFFFKEAHSSANEIFSFSSKLHPFLLNPSFYQ